MWLESSCFCDILCSYKIICEAMDMQALLILNLIVPFVMLVVSFLLRKHPVTDMQSHNGYNTPTSRTITLKCSI